MINANIIAPLVHLLQTAEFDIKKEAAWAISNATSGGTHDQIKYAFFFSLHYLCIIFIEFFIVIMVCSQHMKCRPGTLLPRVASSHSVICLFAQIPGS